MVGKIGVQFKKIINSWVTIAVMKVFTRKRDITKEGMINYLGDGSQESFL